MPRNSPFAAEIGYRLAALADGEGCFYISQRTPTAARLKIRPAARTVYVCAFSVHLRADDRPFLERMQQETSLGRVIKGDPGRGNDKPRVLWTIDTKAACVALVGIVDQYPLWSKKARDYAIWREAVLFWSQTKPGDDLDQLRELHGRLKNVRAYKEAA